MFLRADRTIKREAPIIAEERSVAIVKFCWSTSDKRNLGELVAWGGTIISECRVPPPYLSLLYQSTSSALAINKGDVNQKKQSTASQLPDTPASLTLTLTSAITPQYCENCDRVRYSSLCGTGSGQCSTIPISYCEYSIYFWSERTDATA